MTIISKQLLLSMRTDKNLKIKVTLKQNLHLNNLNRNLLKVLR